MEYGIIPLKGSNDLSLTPACPSWQYLQWNDDPREEPAQNKGTEIANVLCIEWQPWIFHAVIEI